jgi:hypothetical protein
MTYTAYIFSTEFISLILSPINGVVTQTDTTKNSMVLRSYVYADSILIEGIIPILNVGSSFMIGTTVAESMGSSTPMTIHLPDSYGSFDMFLGMFERKQ